MTYPLKSAGGYSAQQAEVTPLGLRHDRRWVVLDPQGKRISARECHALLGISAKPIDTEQVHSGLRLTDRDGRGIDVAVPGPNAREVPVQISRLDQLVLADADASAWITAVTGRDLRLAYLADERAREIGRSHGGRPGEMLSLADAGPVLLVTESSADRLRDLVAQESGEEWLDRAEAIERFRPNVVVDGGVPFAEDAWGRVRIGGVTYRLGEQCDRCVMTTLDPRTLETGPEPIRTLARHRRWSGSTWFGIRLIPELPAGRTGQIGIGDELSVVEPVESVPRE